jgi:hypothetical protein
MEGTSIGARYPVVLRTGDTAPVSGGLSLATDELLFRSRSAELGVPYADVVGVRIGRLGAERLNGSPTVVLERRDAPDVVLAPLGVGLVHELADILASLTGAAGRERIDVIVALRPRAAPRVRALVADGPPFDPAALRLRRHDVYLGERDVVFSFEGAGIAASLRRIFAGRALWRAAVAWRSCLAGRPLLLDLGHDPAIGRELLYSFAAFPSARPAG